MRIVAGSAKGRTLRAPKGTRTRPTSDRVREAIFNALWSLDAIDGAAVADLFAGSGALGIEALSRGADSVVFVDDDADAVETIRANLGATGFAERATVVRRDAVRWAVADPAAARHFDLVLADPPYAFEGWDDLLGALDADVVVCESGKDLEPPAGWDVVRRKRYGTTVVTVLKPSSEPA